MQKIEIDYSIVIPVYQGERWLKILHQQLLSTFEDIPGAFEIIMVDDRSPDRSWQVMNEIQKQDARVRLVQLSRNYGQHNATLCGFNYCRGEYVITMDDDLQHQPDEIPKLISEIRKGFLLVYGQYEKKHHGWFRNIGSHVTNKILSKITNNKFDLTSFRVIKRDVINNIIGNGTPGVILDLLIFNTVSSADISYCPIRHNESESSSYGFLALLSIASDMIINYTIAPLKLIIFVGFVFSMLGFGLGIFYVIAFLSGSIDVDGFTTLVLLITFFAGAILFVLGIIGEYIGRIFLKVSGKPLYIVRQTIFKEE